jgi:OOP family OmpA-OmpF porin
MAIKLTASANRFSAVLTAAFALAGITASVGCVSPPPPREAIEATVVETGENAALKIDQLVILLDASGSMDAASRFLSTQNLASSFVAGMPEGSYSAAVVTFGGNASEILEFAPFDRDDLDSAVIDGELLGKSTDIPAVLGEVQNLLEGRSGTTAIVLFSDGKAARYGRDLGARSTLAAADRLVARYPDNICFYTVQSGDDPAGSELMRGLAAVTDCGKYRRANALTDASSLYELEQYVFVETGLPAVGAAPIFVDRDRDGVEDGSDQCLDTPLMAHVNAFGCWVLKNQTFDTKKYRILESQYAALDEVAEVLNMNPKLHLRIDGHTDSMGTEAFNQTLSEQRADAVRDYLEANGVAAGRLMTEGFGMNFPLASNNTPEGMATNRRCEMTVLR